VTLYNADCLDVMPNLPTVDAVVTDPPYAEIDRDYGRLTEADWHALMNAAVPMIRNLVLEKGSAVFVLQANSERVGRMRGWLWEFMARWTREWNMPQDAWWWNFATPPTVHCHRENGLMRPSMKACVWLGDVGCYRNQDAVLLSTAEATMTDKRINRHDLGYSPSGLSMRHARALAACQERGGATPFNVVVCANSDSSNGAGAHGHGAGTPMELVSWWVRYLSPEGSTILDPFMGTGTTGLACLRTGRKFIGIEKDPRHFASAVERIKREESQGTLV
jgi:hypothetical protein